MNIQLLHDFFFWCMIINSSIYVISALATVFAKEFMSLVLNKVFEYDRAESHTAVQRYLGNYKLLITFFNITPWIVLFIIK